MKKAVVVVLILVALVGGILAVKRVSPMSWGCYGHINAPGGVALGGYDPVAYQTTGKATPGDPAITGIWNGVTWRFASAMNMKKFMKAPGKFAPQTGGFC